MEPSNIINNGILLVGAEAIAEYLYGDPGQRRRVYYLAEKHELPIFTLGGKLTARPTTLTRAIEDRESASRVCQPSEE